VVGVGCGACCTGPLQRVCLAGSRPHKLSAGACLRQYQCADSQVRCGSAGVAGVIRPSWGGRGEGGRGGGKQLSRQHPLNPPTPPSRQATQRAGHTGSGVAASNDPSIRGRALLEPALLLRSVPQHHCCYRFFRPVAAQQHGRQRGLDHDAPLED